MAYLVDTSVLARLANSSDVFYPVATQAIIELHRRGEPLHITPQNLIEFRNVATRLVSLNGLGLSVDETEAKAVIFERTFQLLTETPDIYPAWKAMVHSLSVIGKQVHDARLASVCHVHGVTHVLTFNVAHFTRFASYGPTLTVVDPGNV